MTIKEFAKLCECNTQTLRYYDRINLLKPEKVDPYTGYRQYDEKQLFDYIKIKKLQMASFSLEEIYFLLTTDPLTVYDAFTKKIKEQTVVLQKLKELQKSYQKEFMNVKELIENTKTQVIDIMSNYNPQEEFGITDEEYKHIISKVAEYFDSSNYAEVDENSEINDEAWISPKDDPEYMCIYENHGWGKIKEFFGDIIKLDSGEYLFHFEVNKEKTAYSAFCNIALGIVLKANEGKKMTLGCECNDSPDDKNHFWLFKRNI